MAPNDVYQITIGSRPDNDLVFDRTTVSALHARIFWQATENRWVLEDLGSTNGTYLSGEKLTPHEPVAIELGDRVHLGKSVQFVIEASHFARWTEETVSTLPDAQVVAPDTEDIPREGVPQAEASPAAGATGTAQGPPDASRYTIDLGAFVEAPSPRERTVEVAPISDDEVAESAEPHEPRQTPLEQAHTVGQPTLQISQGQLEALIAARKAAERVQETTDAPPVDAPVISIGYADDNTVQIKNPVVSGRHARLYKVGDGYILEDQGSTNGTWVEGTRIQRVRLRPSDEFSVGNYALRIPDLEPYFERARAVAAPSEGAAPALARPILVGRSPTSDIRINAPIVSAQHCQLTPLPGDIYRLEDLESTNGTYVNSRANRVTQATVGTDDVLFLGSYRLPVSRIPSLLGSVAGEQALEIPGKKDLITVGRDKGCDIVLAAPQVSRRHAELRRRPDGTFELRDLGSNNGTFVNGQRIKGSVVISATDLVSFASYQVRLDDSAGLVRRDYHGDIMLQAERVTVSVKDRSRGGVKTILRDASFTVFPTEFVGLMGPSGAGKTTLMLALNGYTPPSAGRSLINGHDLYTHYDSFRGNIGYVPQDDIIYRQLTVQECLYYTAKLRLPPDTTDAEIERKIDDILRNLEIEGTRDVIVGDALAKGISGGQRKRVNLAQELITEPSLLFLDEPTSGLASEDTINVMNLLRRLADEGRTILLTIHQPSLEAYRKLDNVIYLFEGRLVYYGPAYPDSITFFHPNVAVGTPEGDLLLSDPGNVLKALAEDKREAAEEGERSGQEEGKNNGSLEAFVEARTQRFLASQQYKDFVYDRATAPARDKVRLAEGSKQKVKRRGTLRQWWILTRRCFTIKRKDTVNTAILLLQAPVIASVLWLVFAGQIHSYFEEIKLGPSALFLLMASAVWFGCSNSAREIVGEQAIYRRERMVNLMIPSYVLSKFAVLGLVCAIQCAILLGIVHTTLDYSGSWWTTYVIMLLTSLAGVGMGLTLSALVRSTEAAIALVPMLLIPQIILGGIIVPIHQLGGPMQVLSAAMVTRWGFEAGLHVEYDDDDLDTVRDFCGIDVCPDPIATRGGGDIGYGTAIAAERVSDLLIGVASGVRTDAGDGERVRTGYGTVTDRNYQPRGPGAEEDVCNVLCTNARRGIEVTPLERAFGLDLGENDAMRHTYQQEYGVGHPGSQTSLGFCAVVLVVFNLLMFALVCSILRLKDVEVG